MTVRAHHSSLATLAMLLSLAPVASPLRACAQGERAPGYHVVRRVPLGGESGWDYLVADSARRRLFVTHGTHVIVLDIDRDSVIGDIPNTPGVHGVALAPDIGHGFTSNGRDSSVTVFDLATLAVVGRIAVPARNPDAILYEPTTKRVFTMNGGSSSTTAIDGATGRIVGTIALDGRPEFATADGRGTIYINLEDSSAVVALDARSLTIRARWPLAPCEEPTGMAIDRASSRLVVGCGNHQMAVLDATTGRVLTTLPIGAGVDATAFDPATHLAFSSNGEGTITVAREENPDRFRIIESVATQRGARTMTLDPRTHMLYTVTATFGPRPAPTPEQPRPRPSIVRGSFVLLVLAPEH